MEIIRWLIIIFGVAFIIYRFLPVKGIEQISSKEVKDKQKNREQVQFIDVRTRGEYERNSQKPFTNIPLNKLPRRSRELDKEKETVLICQTGIRSMRAAKILKGKGFEHITNVKGGLSNWE